MWQIARSIRKVLSPFSDGYARLFSIEEVASSTVLQWMFGGSLLFFFLTFNVWISDTQTTVEAARNGAALCWPFFQHCSDFYFLHAAPYGYSQNTFYMALYGVMLLIVWAMWRKKWTAAHALLSILLIWEVLVVLFAYREAAPYYYYHITLTGILLFARYKEFFLKLAFVVMYFLAATIKLNDGWILGTYFTSLQNGLPLFPNISVPLVTNVVIFSQIVGAWFLLSRNATWKNLILFDLIFFHLYSGIFVKYNYPTAAIVPLLILFGPLWRYTPIPFTKKAWFGWLVIALLCVFQVVGFMVPGDRRLTLENNRWGMFMFEANHQCVAEQEIYYSVPRTPVSWESPAGTPCNGFYCLVRQSVTNTATGSVEERRYESGTAWNRCYPYDFWSRLNSVCERDPTIERIALRLDHSINGGPFFRIIDLPDICAVDFQPFAHNSWIKLPPEAPIDGYPVMNSYHY